MLLIPAEMLLATSLQLLMTSLPRRDASLGAPAPLERAGLMLVVVLRERLDRFHKFVERI